MTGFEERMGALRERFVEQACCDAAKIEARASEMAWHDVRDLSHAIVGRAGMFGFSALSDAARMLEGAIDEGEAPDRLQALAEDLIAQLRGLSGQV